VDLAKLASAPVKEVKLLLTILKDAELLQLGGRVLDRILELRALLEQYCAAAASTLKMRPVPADDDIPSDVARPCHASNQSPRSAHHAERALSLSGLTFNRRRAVR